jgi:hypothetical protein
MLEGLLGGEFRSLGSFNLQFDDFLLLLGHRVAPMFLAPVALTQILIASGRIDSHYHLKPTQPLELC